jgi:hypothetical protein
MNGRIKQLAKESNLMEFIDGLQPIIYAHDIKRVEKFAELIVKECIKVINDNVEVALDATGNVVFEDELLKEHFGVDK